MLHPTFADIDFNFTRHPISNDITRKTDAEAIKISMRNLIRTSFYERLFRSGIGSSVNKILFEPSSPIVAVMVKQSIEQVITNFEPRVSLHNVTAVMTPDLNAVNIMIEYTILGTQTLQSFSTILNRSR